MNEIQRVKIINKTLNQIYPNIVVPLKSRNVFTLLISVLLFSSMYRFECK